MSSESFDSSLLDEIIEEALSESPETKNYGQLGFMETDIVSSIFEAIDKKLPNGEVLKIIKEARVNANGYKTSLKITDLHTAVVNCRKCGFASATPVLPKWNVKNPEVLFLFETPYIDPASSEFFISTLKDVGFSSENLCLTYLTRCPARDITSEHISNCVHYFHTEVQIINPRIICTVGAVALSALLGTEVKMKDYKQKITWLGSWPIYPLYSLAYVLKSGDSAQVSFREDLIQLYQLTHKESAQFNGL